jgi:PAS domain S-box-containing protein
MRFQDLADFLPHLVWTAESDGTVDYFNIRCQEFDGFTQLPDGTWQWEPVVHPDDLTPTISAWRYALETGMTYQISHRIKRSDKTYRWYLSRAVAVCDDQGRIVKWCGTATDIDDQKRAEEALRQYDLLSAHISDIIFFIRREDMRILEANAAAVTQYGYTREELLSKTIDDLCADKDLNSIAKQIALADDSGLVFETVHRRKDGSRFNVEVSSRGASIHGMRTLVSVVRNITERKQAEEQIRASLREKEILLQEIHHRVKNNMQVIKSLLNLQAATIQDDRLKEQFNESSSRVNAMAIVHEILYQSESLARIDLHTYVSRLASGLYGMYRASAKGIRLMIEVKDVFLSMDEAVPCGLVINELISNALKYAFSESQSGEITIKAHTREPEQIELGVSDNGIGLPQTIELHKVSSLGLKLVRGLIESQLGGTIQIERRGGTRFTIRFPRQPDPDGIS